MPIIPIHGKLVGLEEIQKTLLALEAKYFRRATRKGVNEATKLVLAAAKDNVPERTGSLKKALGRKVVSGKTGKSYIGVVGPRKDLSERQRGILQREFEQGLRKKGPGKPRYRRIVKYRGREILVNPIKYAHLVEYGTAPASPTKKRVMSDGVTIFGTHTAGAAPRPFLRPAWDGTKDACEAAILASLKDVMSKVGQ